MLKQLMQAVSLCIPATTDALTDDQLPPYVEEEEDDGAAEETPSKLQRELKIDLVDDVIDKL